MGNAMTKNRDEWRDIALFNAQMAKEFSERLTTRNKRIADLLTLGDLMAHEGMELVGSVNECVSLGPFIEATEEWEKLSEEG